MLQHLSNTGTAVARGLVCIALFPAFVLAAIGARSKEHMRLHKALHSHDL